MGKSNLYLYSLEEARRRGELPLWQASQRTNIACRDALSGAVKACDDSGVSGTDCMAKIIHKFGGQRTAWVLANTLQHLNWWPGLFSPANQAWARQFYIPLDGYNGDYVVPGSPAVLDCFVTQYRKFCQSLGLFELEHCIPNSKHQLDYTGRVLVLSPAVLDEPCWSPQGQLWYAHDGPGCNPDSIVGSIRATRLADGEQACWNRTNFAGALQDELLPDWARKPLLALRSQGRQDKPSMCSMRMG